MKKPRATKPKAEKFYWCQRGHVACEKHIPLRGSDTWRWDRWQRMPAKEVEALRADNMLRCDGCSRVERANNGAPRET